MRLKTVTNSTQEIPQTGDVLYGRVGAKGTLKGYGFNKTLDMKYEKQKKGYRSAPIPQYVLDTLRDDATD